MASRFAGPEWQRLVAALHAAALPAVLVEPPSDAIVAANEAAACLLDDCGDDLVGRAVNEFIVGGTTGALDLLADDRLSAYETRHSLRSSRDPVHVWVRKLPVDQPCCAVVVLLAEHGPARPGAGELPSGQVVAIGSVDARLVIAHMTPDSAGILGSDAGELLGTSLLQLVDPGDVAELLEFASRPPATAANVTSTVRAQVRGGGHAARCDVVLVPNAAGGGYAFTVVAVDERSHPLERALHSSLQLLSAQARAVPAAERAVRPAGKEQLARLGSRELEVVTLLLNGNRVPAIARKLFLSPGTVRNHLSSAYRKLGVTNQQELIDLLRGAAPDG